MFHITIIFVLIIIRKTSCKTIQGDCYHIDENGKKNSYCCDHFEKKNGTCKECAVGYSSQASFPCKKCSNNAYGLKCVESCHCTAEKCDHVRGCISEFSSNESTSVNATQESSIWLQTSSAYTEGRTGEHTQGVLIYIICVGALTLVVTLTVIVMIHKRRGKQVNRTARYHINNSSNLQTQDLPDELYTTIL